MRKNIISLSPWTCASGRVLLKNIQCANVLSNGDSYVMLHSAYLFFFLPPGSYIFNLLSCQTVFNKIKIRT